eukprot:612935-Amphidinium_carterae.8
MTQCVCRSPDSIERRRASLWASMTYTPRQRAMGVEAYSRFSKKRPTLRSFNSFRSDSASMHSSSRGQAECFS